MLTNEVRFTILVHYPDNKRIKLTDRNSLTINISLNGSFNSNTRKDIRGAVTLGIFLTIFFCNRPLLNPQYKNRVYRNTELRM